MCSSFNFTKAFSGDDHVSFVSNCYCTGVSFSQQGQIFFLSSNNVLFNVSFKILDSCLKVSFFSFTSAISSSFKFPFAAFLLWNLNFFFSPMLQRISNVPIDSFSTSCWLTGFQRRALKNRRRNQKWAFD